LLIKTPELKIAIVILIITLYLYFYGHFEWLEMKILDLRFQFRGIIHKESQVVLIPITDECRRKLYKKEKITWPFKRKVYARVLNKLNKLGIKNIGMDISIDTPDLSDPASDLELITAASKLNMVCPVIFERTYDFADGKLKAVDKIIKPLPGLVKASKALGFINLDWQHMNKDGIIRKIPAKKLLNNKIYFPFSIELASLLLNKQQSKSLKQKLRSRSYFYVNFLDTNKYIIPFHKLYLEKNNILMNSPAKFKNKIMLIGPSFGERDIVKTPFGQIRGMEIHANVVNEILNKTLLTRIPVYLMGIILFFATLLIVRCLIIKRLTELFLILFSVFYFLIITYIFHRFHYIIDVVPLFFLIVFSYIITRFYQLYIRLWQSNQKLNATLKELSILYEISKELSMTRIVEQNKRLRLLLNHTIKAVGAERGSIMLLDPLTGELSTSVVSEGTTIDESKKVKLKLGEGIAGKVVETGKSLIVNTGSADKRFKTTKKEDENIESLLCVPLLVQNKGTGVINLVNKKNGQEFTHKERKLVETIAVQAANVIENARLYREATVDGLTNLYVHRHFQKRLAEEMYRTKRYKKDLSLLMTDIDHFKKFNDTYGHQTGDLVLKSVAKIIQDTVRDIDIPARYGGEEFIVILPETDAKGAFMLAERIRTTIESTKFNTPQGELSVTLSIGVSSFWEAGVDDKEEFIKTADIALYKAKENGRNQTQIYVRKA